MRVYETTFIINPQVDDATIDQQVAAVSEIITKSGGKILHEQRVGTRRMAYAIKGIAQGYYTSLYHEAPTEALDSLKRHFRLGELYLRDLTIRFEGDLETVAEQQSISESFARRRPDGDRDRDRRPGPGRGPGRDRDSRPGRDVRSERPSAPKTEPKPPEAITEKRPNASEPEVKPVKETAEETAAPASQSAVPTATPQPTIPAKPETTPIAPAAEEAPPAGQTAVPTATPRPTIPPKPETTPIAPAAEETATPAPEANVEPKSSEPPAPESYNEEDEL